ACRKESLPRMRRTFYPNMNSPGRCSVARAGLFGSGENEPLSRNQRANLVGEELRPDPPAQPEPVTVFEAEKSLPILTSEILLIAMPTDRDATSPFDFHDGVIGVLAYLCEAAEQHRCGAGP